MVKQRPPIEKNKVYEVDIIDVGNKGEGIGKIEGYILYINYTLPGDRVLVKITKVKKNYGFGRLIDVVIPSPDRVDPPCPIAKRCGGCQIQYMAYPKQLAMKKQRVQAALQRIGGFSDVIVPDVIGMTTPFHYRNKVQFAIGQRDDDLNIGLYAVNSHDIIDAKECFIQHDLTNQALSTIRAFLSSIDADIYDETTHKGLIRHLLIRASFSDEECLVCLVINGDDWAHKDAFVDTLKTLPFVSSVYLNHNTVKTDTILGTTFTHLAGDTHIYETIKGTRYTLSPASFFQVNPGQTVELFDAIRTLGRFQKTDCVWDLYCGTGSIGLALANDVASVLGVEDNSAAVEDAKRNATLNDIDNCHFICAKAESTVTTDIQKQLIEYKLDQPDIIIVDPPRKGCHPDLLDFIGSIAPQRLIYVSCDPGTLARDLNILCQDTYDIDSIQPIDMFPHTVHVETVVALTRKR